MSSEIHFYIDVKEETIPDDILSDAFINYADTKKAIENRQEIIHTMDISHLSFCLIDRGYDIYDNLTDDYVDSICDYDYKNLKKWKEEAREKYGVEIK